MQKEEPDRSTASALPEVKAVPVVRGLPKKPDLYPQESGENYPVIYAGHGDLVEDGRGNWYVVMLASRPCEGHSSMGRETFLAKVTWENGWPVIAEGIGHLEDTLELPTKNTVFQRKLAVLPIISVLGENTGQTAGKCRRNP